MVACHLQYHGIHTYVCNFRMENIRYGRLDATDEEVIAAAKAAHIHNFIMQQPGGYDMVLDEETSNISQGQKQLLTIGDEQTKLTTKENELLALLCAHANEILQRDFALKTIWIDDNYFNARSMDVYITKLRKHLKEDPQIEIINIHGKGYKLIAPEQD